MPLVKIDIVRDIRTPEEIRKLADVIQEVMLEKFNAPYRDRYQIVTQHAPGEIICEDTNLNLQRTNKLVIIQIFQQGRDAKTKQATYAELARRLEKDCGVPGSDLVISCARNEREDWSFGMGQAQFLTGQL